MKERASPGDLSLASVAGEVGFLRTYYFSFSVFRFYHKPHGCSNCYSIEFCVRSGHISWRFDQLGIVGLQGLSDTSSNQSVAMEPYIRHSSRRIRSSLHCMCLADGVRCIANSKDCLIVLFFWTIDKQPPHSPTLLDKIRFNVGTCCSEWHITTNQSGLLRRPWTVCKYWTSEPTLFLLIRFSNS